MSHGLYRNRLQARFGHRASFAGPGTNRLLPHRPVSSLLPLWPLLDHSETAIFLTYKSATATAPFKPPVAPLPSRGKGRLLGSAHTALLLTSLLLHCSGPPFAHLLHKPLCPTPAIQPRAPNPISTPQPRRYFTSADHIWEPPMACCCPRRKSTSLS